MHSVRILAAVLTFFASSTTLTVADDVVDQAKIIEGLELKVIVKTDEVGDSEYYARFINRGKQSRFIVRTLDGSQHRRSMPYYDFTGKDSKGRSLKLLPKFCGNIGLYGLYDRLEWPDDYVREIKLGESYDENITKPFNLKPGEKYELTGTYTYTPSESLRRNLGVPKYLDTGTVRGTPSEVIGPPYEELHTIDFSGMDPGLIGFIYDGSGVYYPARTFSKPQNFQLRYAGMQKETYRWLQYGTHPLVNHKGQIRVLQRDGVELSGYDLRRIQNFAKLKKLYVSKSLIDNSALHMLSSLEHVVDLYFAESGLNDQGLQRLQRIAALKRLVLYKTKVTDQGIQAFRQARPEVNLDVILPEE